MCIERYFIAVLALVYSPPAGQQSFGLSLLNDLQPGLAAEVLAAGRAMETLHLTRPSGKTITKIDMTPITKAWGYPFMGITRYALQNVFLKHLANSEVQLGSRLQDLHTHELEGITELRFEGRADGVRARAVLGADGRRCSDKFAVSRIRGTLFDVELLLYLASRRATALLIELYVC